MSTMDLNEELACLCDTQIAYIQEIERGKEQIAKLYAQIAEINKNIIHPVVMKKTDIDKKIIDARQRLQNQTQNPMIGRVNVSKIMEQNLESLPLPIINHIIKYRYGTDLLEVDYPAEWPYNPNLTRDQYRLKVIQIIRNRSCNYCHLVTHNIKECPDLLQKKQRNHML